MKKLLSLAIVAAALCVSAGCEDKKSTGTSGTKSPTPAAGGASSAKSGS